jgi:hypothetical protein
MRQGGVYKRSMEKKKHIDPLQFDKRVMQRFVANGKTTNKELDAHLANLPDMAEHCEDISETVYEHFKDVDANDDNRQ